MKVVLAHPSLNRGGGAEKVCLTMLKALVNTGSKVRLATVEKTNWGFLEDRFGPLPRPHEETCFAREVPVRGSFSQAVFTVPSFFSMLMKLHAEEKRNLVVNTYGELFDLFADISYVNALPLRIIHEFPDEHSSQRLLWRTSSCYKMLLKPLENSFGVGTLLSNSIFIKNVLHRYLNRDSVVVYPPVDAAKIMSKGLQPRLEDLVVTVSRFRKGKCLELIPRIARVTARARFKILGIADQASGSTIASLTKQIYESGVKDNVQVLLNRNYRELECALSSAKIFLHTQATEAFGISIVEAMAYGCVPVVPRSGGPWIDILDGKQGQYGYSYSTVEEAARLIEMLLANENLRLEISSKARRRARDFDSSRFERKLLSIISRVYADKMKE
jgi:glycosyltransferase involved in cell wall biosynthesis